MRRRNKTEYIDRQKNNMKSMEAILASVSYDKVFLFLGIMVAVSILVILAIMLDLWDGVYTARTVGERVHSHKLRATVDKMSEYWRFIFIGFLIDCLGLFFHFYILPFVVILFGVGLIIVEAKSMFEHAHRRKSHASELPDILKKIVQASNTQEAREILGKVTDMLSTNTTER